MFGSQISARNVACLSRIGKKRTKMATDGHRSEKIISHTAGASQTSPRCSGVLSVSSVVSNVRPIEVEHRV